MSEGGCRTEQALVSGQRGLLAHQWQLHKASLQNDRSANLCADSYAYIQPAKTPPPSHSRWKRLQGARHFQGGAFIHQGET